jgi:DNA-directed RNA polymerase subunit N (RpoN/RPB10)
VTVSQLPVVRCALCGRTIAHQPGAASTVLTAHYRSAHQDLLSPESDADPDAD